MIGSLVKELSPPKLQTGGPVKGDFEVDPESGFVAIFLDTGEQVFTDDDLEIQVRTGFANS